MTAVGLYAAVGLPTEQAVLIPLVGFTADMAVSALGGLVFLRRRADYAPDIRVADTEREERAHERIERAPESEWPLVTRAAGLGFGAGLIAGLLVGFGEAWAVVAASHGQAEPDVWFFGSFFYALLCGGGGAMAGAALALSGRLMQRKRVAEHVAFAHFGASMLAVFTLVIGAFRVQRDVFHEELKWLSGQGLLVLVGALLTALAVYAVTFFALRALTKGPQRVVHRGRHLARRSPARVRLQRGQDALPRRVRARVATLLASLRERVLDATELRQLVDRPLRLEPRRDVESFELARRSRDGQ
jgi:hypothetical protein